MRIYLCAVAVTFLLVSCAAASTESSNQPSAAVGEERTVEQAREDGCQAAVLVGEANFASLRDFKALLDRGRDQWADVREEAWVIGDMVGDRGEAFYGMGLDSDTTFNSAAVDVHRAYAQFRKQVPGYFAAVPQFRESIDELNQALTVFADYCD